MPTSEDVAITFDPQPFNKGFSQVERRFSGLTKIGQNTAKMVSAAMIKTALVIGFVGVAVKGLVSNVKRYMPEVGATFKAASDIFWNNFLFPLRQQLLPILQKFMNWTRDHRALFVQWGQALVTVFHVLWQLATTAVNIIKQLAITIFPNFSAQMKNGFLNVVNMFLFKLSFLAEAVGLAIQSVLSKSGPALADLVKSLGSLAATILKLGADAITGLFTGLMKQAPFIVEAVDKLVKALDSLFAVAGGGSSLKDLFTWLGNLVGTVLVKAVNFLTAVIQELQIVMDTIKGKPISQAEKNAPGNSIGGVAGSIWNMTTWLPRELIGLGAKLVHAFQGASKAVPNPNNSFNAAHAHDFVLTKQGQLIHTDPQDYIFGVKNPGQSGEKAQKQVNVQHTVHMNLTVTEGNAKAAGIHFGDGFAYGFKTQILNEMVRAGY